MNNVLNNLNALNRSLEGVVAVGKEFESVSLLWNNYYDGLARIEIQQQRAQAEAEARAAAQAAEKTDANASTNDNDDNETKTTSDSRK